VTRLHLSPRKLAAVVAGLAQGADARCQAAPAPVTPATLRRRMAAQKTPTNEQGRGRNPRAGKAATIRCTIRLTADEHTRFQAAAEAAEKDLAAWIRDAAEVVAKGQAGRGARATR